jgi:hypothetical protein
VIHDWSGCGERKKARIGKDVCVSSMSANHASHVCQRALSRSSVLSMRWYRISMVAGLGGLPARTVSRATPFSRREKAP